MYSFHKLNCKPGNVLFECVKWLFRKKEFLRILRIRKYLGNSDCRARFWTRNIKPLNQHTVLTGIQSPRLPSYCFSFSCISAESCHHLVQIHTPTYHVIPCISRLSSPRLSVPSQPFSLLVSQPASQPISHLSGSRLKLGVFPPNTLAPNSS